MVHGAFCGGWVFDRFRRPFEAAGHAVTAIDLPGHSPTDPPEAVTGRSMSDYAGAVIEEVERLPRPPVLLGHSMGGLVSMLAASRSRVAGLVLLAPSPPWGIVGGTVEEAGSAMALYALGPFWAQAVEPDRFVAALYSLDRMEPEAGRAAARSMRAESGRALFETLNWWLDPFMTTSVAPASIRAPIYIGVGERDVIHPPSTVRQTAERFGTTAQVFPDMSHWLVGEPGFEAVANACLGFIADRVSPASP